MESAQREELLRHLAECDQRIALHERLAAQPAAIDVLIQNDQTLARLREIRRSLEEVLERDEKSRWPAWWALVLAPAIYLAGGLVTLNGAEKPLDHVIMYGGIALFMGIVSWPILAMRDRLRKKYDAAQRRAQRGRWWRA
jgi:hypothetical protein